MRRILSLISTLAILFTVGTSQASSDGDKNILVRFPEQITSQQAKVFLQKFGYEHIQTFHQLNLFVAKPIPIIANFDSLQKSPDILYAERSITITAVATPNDPKFDQQPGLKKYGAEAAWDLGTGSRDIIVAVSDTGVSWIHEDLISNIWRNTAEIPDNGIDDDGNGFIDDIHGWDFATDSNDSNDTHNHGSHVAGIIGAEGNNAKGIAGVSWQVNIMPVKFLKRDGRGTLEGAIGTILYAADNGANVINASWGASQSKQSLEDAIKYAGEKNVLFVAAAGNSRANNDGKQHYPSNYDLPNLISVGAANDKGIRANFSNYGSRSVHISAPGVNILSTYRGSMFLGRMSGTSMASPFVAGVAALVLSHNPDLTVTELRNAILNSAEANDSWTGYNATDGMVRVDAAVQSLTAGAKIWPKFVRIGTGRKIALTAWGIESAKWSVSDSSIASVTENGEVEGLADGKVEVTVQDSEGNVISSSTVEVVGSSNGGGCALEGQSNENVEVASASATTILLLMPLLFGILLHFRRRRFL